MTTKLGKIGKVTFWRTDIGKNSKRFLEDHTSIFSGSIQNGKFISQTKLQKKVFPAIAKGLNLVKTPGFGVAAFTIGLGIGILGYFIGKKAGTKDMVQEQLPEEQVPEVKTGKAQVEKYEEAQYHTIDNKGMTWETIVNAYYPALVEKCGGKLYGANGAIRQLKLALSKDMEVNLVNESAIPQTLNLPLEVNGVKINKNANPTHAKCEQGGHTDIKEAGKKTTKTMYNATDKENNAEFNWDKYPDVIDSLKVRTGVDEYNIDMVS